MEILQALGIVLGALLVLAAAVNTVGSAVEKFSKLRNAAKAPNDEQNDRLDELENHVSKHDTLLDQDNDRLRNIEQSNRVTQRALLGLLEHGIDGNSIERMQKSRKELEDYLIEK
jgi:hypothetical protein